MSETARLLRGKTLVMVVGPAAIGKSSLMHSVVDLDDRFGYVRSFTTRPERAGGHTTYQHITDKEADDIETSGSAVTFLRHPTTGHVYGTDASSYPAVFNLLDTLSGSVELYRALPFERTITVSLTAHPDDWQSWFLTRYPNPSDERTRRLSEAVLSADWSLTQSSDHYWLVNQADDLARTARQLMHLVINSTPQNAAPYEARALRDRAAHLLSYEQKKE